MFSGMLYIFTPLVIGYFFSINNKSLLEALNKATSWLIYIILFLMGLSLAALDNFGSNLKTIVTMTLVFFVSIGACNLLSLPWSTVFCH